MRFGPTSLRLASVLAKGLRRPKLRSDLKISEQVFGGEVTYMMHDPLSGNYGRVGAFDYEVMKRCDGTRTPAEIAATLTELYPDQPLTEAEVATWLDNMDPVFWERGVGEKNLAILQKIRDERKQRVDRSNIFNIVFPGWDPDRFLERIHPYFRWMYTREFVAVTGLLFVLTGVIVASDWTRILQDTAEFYNFTNKTAYDLWIFWLIVFFVSGVHELGHALTCKHFGGHVNSIGLLLIYFTPAFYTDTSASYLFERAYKRLWVIFAGIWVELVVCALATFIWYLAPPGSFIGDLSYKTLLLTGVSGVFFNLNPLMKFDGYYALSQWLEIDNLREDSFDYVWLWMRRHLLGQEVELPPVGRRKRRIFLLYGWLAIGYSLLVLYVFLQFVNNIFVSKFGDWGSWLTAGAVFLLMRKRVQRALPRVRAGLRSLKEKVMVWRLTRLQQVAGVALFIVVFVYPPTATKVSTDFILEPGQRAEVRAAADGWVKQVFIREGESVEEGSVLALLSNPELEARVATLSGERALAERRLLAARAGSELAEIQKHQKDMERLEVALEEARRKHGALTLRAPVAGVVTTPQIAQRVGEYLSTGATFTEVADRRTMRARVLVRDWELEDVSEGASVKLNVRAYPLRTFSGRVQRILPAAATDRPVSDPAKIERKGQELSNFFAVVLEFPNQAQPDGDWALKEGMTGTAKIYGRRHPVGVRMIRSAYRSVVWNLL